MISIETNDGTKVRGPLVQDLDHAWVIRVEFGNRKKYIGRVMAFRKAGSRVLS